MRKLDKISQNYALLLLMGICYHTLMSTTSHGLEYYGIRGQLLSWMRSFLRTRLMSSVIEVETSRETTGFRTDFISLTSTTFLNPYLLKSDSSPTTAYVTGFTIFSDLEWSYHISSICSKGKLQSRFLMPHHCSIQCLK